MRIVIVYVVLAILSVFAVVTLVNMNPSLLAFSGYPPFRDIIAGVSLTLFAFLIFSLITVAHLRIRSETGAKLPIPVLAIVAADVCGKCR